MPNVENVDKLDRIMKDAESNHHLSTVFTVVLEKGWINNKIDV